jgi:hypothetical protein
MRIALIAPPFIPVPPPADEGTELFIAQLAEALGDRGHAITVFTNGDSTVRCDVRWMFPHKEWPPQHGDAWNLRNLEHSAWALQAAAAEPFDVVHVNDALAVPPSRFLSKPVVPTLHHPHDNALSALYERHDWVHLRGD